MTANALSGRADLACGMAIPILIARTVRLGVSRFCSLLGTFVIMVALPCSYPNGVSIFLCHEETHSIVSRLFVRRKIGGAHRVVLADASPRFCCKPARRVRDGKLGPSKRRAGDERGPVRRIQRAANGNDPKAASSQYRRSRHAGGGRVHRKLLSIRRLRPLASAGYRWACLPPAFATEQKRLLSGLVIPGRQPQRSHDRRFPPDAPPSGQEG
jgi:hypothetical protein